MIKVLVTELRKQLFDILDKVERGESIAIVRNGRTVATVQGVSLRDKPHIDKKAIATFCRKHKIDEFYLFGSILRDDFGPDSDVDVMISSKVYHDYSKTFKMQEELEAMLGRSVDLLTKKNVLAHKNKYRRESILNSAEVIYAA